MDDPGREKVNEGWVSEYGLGEEACRDEGGEADLASRNMQGNVERLQMA